MADIGLADVLGGESQIALIAIVTGGIVRLFKRMPMIPHAALPYLAFFIGVAMDFFISLQPTGVAGGFAGLAAAGGHDLLLQLGRGLGKERLAKRLLGSPRG